MLGVLALQVIPRVDPLGTQLLPMGEAPVGKPEGATCAHGSTLNFRLGKSQERNVVSMAEKGDPRFSQIGEHVGGQTRLHHAEERGVTLPGVVHS